MDSAQWQSRRSASKRKGMVEMEQEKQAQIEQAVTTILEAVGEDTQRAGLINRT